MKLLPKNVQRLILNEGLSDHWEAYYVFCKDNRFRLRDIWVGFFLIAVHENWLSDQSVKDHLDSMALELYRNVQSFSQQVERIDLNYDSLVTQINGRSLLAQTVESPAAVLIYCTTLYRRLMDKDPLVYHESFAKKIRHLIAPLCVSLNLGFIKWRLEDKAFKILEPDIYLALAKEMEMKRSERERLVRHVSVVLKKLHDVHGIDVIDVRGRAKHFYGVYKKMLRKCVGPDKIYDQVALRILCHSIEDCYKVAQVLDDHYKQIPEEYNDYISMPKDNGYQSLHMAIYYDFTPIEIQIKTEQMHQFNEYGPAAHWMYKDHQAFGDKLNHVFKQKSFQEVLQNRVFVLTPEGDVVSLIHGALPLDFAYAIHSEVGHHCVGVLVNGRMCSLSQALPSGATVQVLTRKSQRPSVDWLRDDHTRSVSSKKHIRLWLRKHDEKVLTPHHERREDSNAVPTVKQKATPAVKRAPKIMIDHHLAKCCLPQSGDEIIGYITRSRGMSVHQTDCEQIKKLDKCSRHRLQHLTWEMLGGEINRYRVECAMDCGYVTRRQVIQCLKNSIIAADWYTCESGPDVSRLRCVLNIQNSDNYSKIKADLLSIVGVISFNKIE